MAPLVIVVIGFIIISPILRGALFYWLSGRLFVEYEDLLRSFGTQYMERVHPDEPNFLDLDKSTAFAAKEFIMYGEGVS